MSAVNLHRKPSLMTFGIVGLVVAVVAAYVASVAMYASSGVAHRHQADVVPAGDETSVTLTVEEVQSNYTVLRANLIFSPGSELLDPQTLHRQGRPRSSSQIGGYARPPDAGEGHASRHVSGSADPGR